MNKTIQQIDNELKRIYHNATLGGKLTTDSDYESDLYQSQLDLEISEALSDENIKDGFPTLFKLFGSIYQYGRGGRTVCFEKLHRDSRYGSAIFKSSDLDLEAYSNETLEDIARELKEFNDSVRSWCSSMPDHILEDIREQYAEQIAENKGKRRTTVVVYR